LGKVRALLLTIEAPASSKKHVIVTKMSDKEREELKKYKDLVQKIAIQEQLKTVELTDKTKKSRQTPFTRQRKSIFLNFIESPQKIIKYVDLQKEHFHVRTC